MTSDSFSLSAIIIKLLVSELVASVASYSSSSAAILISSEPSVSGVTLSFYVSFSSETSLTCTDVLDTQFVSSTDVSSEESTS
ncbi:hypothetical protein EDC94DRAFT_599736 [Helicostylum pulchrum]|nr:hypothetical protein EDC94DRAFT_599736 [Helicostylum pulchrum]